MTEARRILVVDDMPDNVEIAKLRLEREGFAVETAVDGEAALAMVAASPPDLILLDIMMPKVDGIEVTRRLKADASLPFVPIILLTAKAAVKDVVAGLDAGADDYLTKPFDHATMVARVRAMLRIKALHDTVERQARELGELNRTLEARVAAQVAELERTSRLRRFLAPQVAELIMADGGADPLRSRRRDVAAVFCDLRGFTAFAETAEPEDVMAVLESYHATLGPIVFRHEGTVERFVGDGLLILFNDPVPCPDPSARAIRMADAMREAMAAVARQWSARGFSLGFGVGIARGYATIGRIGFEGRFDYSAIGTAVNVAARLCDRAADGQIIVSQRVANEAAEVASFEPLGALELKGLLRPVQAFNVAALAAG
ncbi:MAG: response regulator [Alphaproteobacteria bacterium]|nr:response regulator [Alphaproteobacteria bacterium]